MQALFYKNCVSERNFGVQAGIYLMEGVCLLYMYVCIVGLIQVSLYFQVQ